MSGLVKGIKKVFKKIAKVAKKIVVPLLVAGAVIFTAGAALGLPAMAGGFGGAVTSMFGSVGLTATSTLGKIAIGAVTQAGYGAVVGGTIAAATGGKFMDGASKGALAGAISGGVMGAMGAPTDPLAKLWEGKTPIAPVDASASGALTANSNTAVANVSANAPAVSASAPAVGAAAAPASGGTGFLSGVGNFLTSETGGKLISGAATGLMTGLGNKGASDDRKAEQDRISGSYDLPEGAYGFGNTIPDGQEYLDPKDRFNTRSSGLGNSSRGNGRYEFDPAQGRIVFKDTATA